MKSILATLILSVCALTVVSTVSAKDPAKNDAVKSYPLKKCIVSGEELGSMGKEVTLVQDGQEVKFCCKSCIKKFKADPAKYLAKLR